MLKEKVTFEFESMEEMLKLLEDEHKKYENHQERELIKETLERIIEKIERVNGANQCTIENEENWGYTFDDEFYVVEKYEKYTSAGASGYDERLHAHVEMKTEVLELEFQLEYDVEIVNLIDAPFRHESFGTMSLSYSFK